MGITFSYIGSKCSQSFLSKMLKKPYSPQVTSWDNLVYEVLYYVMLTTFNLSVFYFSSHVNRAHTILIFFLLCSDAIFKVVLFNKWYWHNFTCILILWSHYLMAMYTIREPSRQLLYFIRNLCKSDAWCLLWTVSIEAEQKKGKCILMWVFFVCE